MDYRKKLILNVLAAYNGSLRETEIQHLIFRIVQQQEKPSYTFFPYRYGCYSITLKEHIDYLQSNFPLKLEAHLFDRWGDGYDLTHPLDDDLILEDETAHFLKRVVEQYQEQSIESLITENLFEHPYFGKKCIILDELFSPIQQAKLFPSKPKSFESFVKYFKADFPTFEFLINEVIRHDISFVLEVGNIKRYEKIFRKNWLKRLNVKYLNIWDDRLFSIRRIDQLDENNWEEFSQRLAYLQLSNRRVACIVDVDQQKIEEIEEKVLAWTK